MNVNYRAATAAIILAAIAAAASANLINNGGFETSPNSATDWGHFSNASWFFNDNTVPTPHTGLGEVKIYGTFPGASGYYQNFAASAGQTFSGGAFGYDWSQDALQGDAAGFVRIVFFNASGTELAGGQNSNVMSAASTQNVWTSLSITSITAPTGTDHGQVLLLGTNGASGGSTWFDDVQVNAVPEPMTMTVLGLAIAGMIRRKKNV